MKFIVSGIQAKHRESGLSRVEASTQSGVAYNTVKRYTSKEPVLVGHIDPSLCDLCRFYGLDWRDPRTIRLEDESIEDDDPEEGLETETPQAELLTA